MSRNWEYYYWFWLNHCSTLYYSQSSFDLVWWDGNILSALGWCILNNSYYKCLLVFGSRYPDGAYSWPWMSIFFKHDSIREFVWSNIPCLGKLPYYFRRRCIFHWSFYSWWIFSWIVTPSVLNKQPIIYRQQPTWDDAFFTVLRHNGNMDSIFNDETSKQT